MPKRAIGGLLGAGGLLLLALGGAGLLEDRIAWRRCVTTAESLVAHENGAPTEETVGELLAGRYPDAKGWQRESVADGDLLRFESGDGTDYTWHCSDDDLPFITAQSEAAGQLTPFHRALGQIVDDIRSHVDTQARAAGGAREASPTATPEGKP